MRLLDGSRAPTTQFARLAAIFLLLTLSACATPPEVKTLSTAQVAYLDAAIAAVQSQTDALLAACEIIRQDAEAQIETNLMSSNQSGLTALASAPADRRAEVAATVLEITTMNAQGAINSRVQLQTRLAEIKSRTDELLAFLAQMKDAQMALDGYLQSAQVGERFTSAILGSPDAQALIGRVTSTMNMVRARSGELLALVNTLKPAG